MEDNKVQDELKSSAKKSTTRLMYYVTARKDSNGNKQCWEVKKAKAEKVTKICKTKKEAIDYVKEIAARNDATVIIYKMDGSIDETLKFVNGVKI